MDKFVLELKTEVPKAFEAGNYEYEREAIEKVFRTQSEELIQNLTKKANESELQLMQSPHGFTVLPIVNGKVLTKEDRAKLREEELKKISLNEEKIISELHDAVRQFEQLQKDARNRVLELDQKVVSFSVNHLICNHRERRVNFL
jgi:hypothetical protein